MPFCQYYYNRIKYGGIQVYLGRDSDIGADIRIIQDIGHALLDPETRIERLALSFNAIGPEGVTLIAKQVFLERDPILLPRPRLNVLHLSFNNLGPEGAVVMAEVLKTNTTLEELSLQRNNIQCEGTIAFATALETNRTLKLLDLDDDHIGIEGILAFLKVLVMLNTTLETLSLYQNNVDVILETNERLLRKELVPLTDLTRTDGGVNLLHLDLWNRIDFEGGVSWGDGTTMKKKYTKRKKRW